MGDLLCCLLQEFLLLGGLKKRKSGDGSRHSLPEWRPNTYEKALGRDCSVS